MQESTTVLVVDDDPDDFYLVNDILESHSAKNYEVEHIDNFSDGLDAVLEQRHQLYLIDFCLGSQNGLSIVRVARESGVTEPVILMTGNGYGQLDQDALVAGVDDYLDKELLAAGRVGGPLLEKTIRYCKWKFDQAGNVRRASEHLGAIAELIPQGVAEWDALGNEQFASEKWRALFGEEGPSGPELWSEVTYDGVREHGTLRTSRVLQRDQRRQLVRLHGRVLRDRSRGRTEPRDTRLLVVAGVHESPPVDRFFMRSD